jgi:hypothetical protein
MAKKFYLYERKPGVWYARFRSLDGTISSPVRIDKVTNREGAVEWAA